MCLKTASEPDSSVTGKGKWPEGLGQEGQMTTAIGKKKQVTVAVQGRAHPGWQSV